MPAHGRPYRFSGFRSPRYTQVPDEAFDELMAELSPAEFKVMMYIVRRTFGFKKDCDAISLAQIVHGVRRRDGRVIDRGTGLSKSGVVKAIRGLLQKNVILTATRQSVERGHEATLYRLNLVDAEAFFPGPEDPRTTPLVHSVDKGASPLSRQAPVHSVDTQEPAIQDTECLSQLAEEFLRSIGYARPSKAKRERATRILKDLTTDDGYSLDELRTACQVAVSLGARGPELIPHVIGQRAAMTDVTAEVGERLARAQIEARHRWEQLGQRFDALPEAEQKRLVQQAKQTNRILAERADNHPLVRAAAMSELEPKA